MAAPSKIENLTEVKRWYDEGRTYKWMVEEYERKYNLQVSQSLFSTLRFRHGWEKRNYRDRNLIPWRVMQDHEQQYPIVMLRAEARRRAGLDLPEELGHRLDSWLQRLKERDAVVFYDKELGFFYVPREDGDDDIIRRP